ncbi:hypothetical protein PS467_36165 [Streptomyces luomodiensis]|uniref:Uncharacterized protein n=1 Tax=Streptomyces luomodiensis TaxID=3026192 RepID=A0ABY9VCG2_9ACTN|nr:hypothetical protein [Streptomyces sp. SCA4-21]WNF00376.1 hypothetical protein PS467_36165 [Streptomyces sp. SCA4-21]
MRSMLLPLVFAAALPLLLSACSSASSDGSGAATSSSSTPPSSAASAPTSSASAVTDPDDSGEVADTIVRFTAGDTSVDVTMEDNPAARDFLYSSTHAEDSLVLGSYDATIDELEQLEGRDVTVEAIP